MANPRVWVALGAIADAVSIFNAHLATRAPSLTVAALHVGVGLGDWLTDCSRVDSDGEEGDRQEVEKLHLGLIVGE